jgi:hypothetical protein
MLHVLLNHAVDLIDKRVVLVVTLRFLWVYCVLVKCLGTAVGV